MNLEKQNILFFSRTMELGGTENVVLQLCEIFHPIVNKIVVCSCGGVNVKRLIKMGIVHYEIPDIENKNPQEIIRTITILKRVIKEERITIIHTHHRMAAFYISFLKLYKGRKFFNTCHNTFYNKKILTKYSYNHATLIACGDQVKDNLVNIYSIAENKIKVIKNAIKPFNGKIIGDSLIDKMKQEGNFVIGNIGRLSEQKGFEYYINAINKVIEKHPKTKFLIIGTGEDELKLKKIVVDLKLNNYVYFLGYRNDIQNIISQIDLVVLSSLWEGLPLTPIETFSVKKTIIATSVDGTVEIVENEKNGFLIPPKNSTEIAKKINWIIEHPIHRNNLEKNAYITFLEKFSFKRLAEEYIKVYKGEKHEYSSSYSHI